MKCRSVLSSFGQDRHEENEYSEKISSSQFLGVNGRLASVGTTLAQPLLPCSDLSPGEGWTSAVGGARSGASRAGGLGPAGNLAPRNPPTRVWAVRRIVLGDSGFMDMFWILTMGFSGTFGTLEIQKEEMKRLSDNEETKKEYNERRAK